MVFAQISGEAASLEGFIMSCRSMGRGVETAILNNIKRELFENRGVGVLDGVYIPTRKNKPAGEFYTEQGFAAEEGAGSGEQRYRLEKSASSDLPTHGISVKWMDGENGQ